MIIFKAINRDTIESRYTYFVGDGKIGHSDCDACGISKEKCRTVRRREESFVDSLHQNSSDDFTLKVR